MSTKYLGIIRYAIGKLSRQDIIHTFHTNNEELAIARLSLLLEKDYPYGRGQLVDLVTRKVIYECRRNATC
ncbi:MAG TPA: hypothetical protein VHZ76_04395 [Gammaproteobacteria bacterium]|jgi:hypothetical protein|nr:hypothetical protein [Gammaproteobacteria bacterium]